MRSINCSEIVAPKVAEFMLLRYRWMDHGCSMTLRQQRSGDTAQRGTLRSLMTTPTCKLNRMDMSHMRRASRGSVEGVGAGGVAEGERDRTTPLLPPMLLFGAQHSCREL